MSAAAHRHDAVLPERQEVALWCARFVESPDLIGRLGGWLSEKEKATAARFLREQDRLRYVFAHGAVRHILGSCLGRDPAGLEFATGPHGKPALVLAESEPALTFNLSHSADLVLCAVAVGRAVGVDVELMKEAGRDLLELARAQFSSDESVALQGMARGELTEAFYRCWTLKEAYVKARGEGLAFPLKDFSVSLQAGEEPGIVWSVDDACVRERWTSFLVTPAQGYAGALVCEGRGVRMTRHWWGGF